MEYKVRYSVRAHVWNPRDEDYEYETLLDGVESEAEARDFYNKTEVIGDRPQVELWEALVNRYDVEAKCKRLAAKDALGEIED